MHVEQLSWSTDHGWISAAGPHAATEADLVLYFGSRAALSSGRPYEQLRARYATALLYGCSTGGQIQQDEVGDDGVLASAISFDTTKLRAVSASADITDSSCELGRRLGAQLVADDLAAIFVLADGLCLNGSELVRGMRTSVGLDIPITGGLAGDGADFQETLVGCDAAPAPRVAAAVGFYGREIRFGHGGAGGWDIFGPRRRITRAEGNTLYELDGRPALELYKRYLGEEALNLPSSALLFPLKIWPADNVAQDVVRTVLSVDEERQSMTFAGNVPQGHVAQLMRGNFDHLVDGAEAAARKETQIGAPEFCILVSCIGRKLLMGQQISDEVEAVGEIIGRHTPRIGFYAYGEIAPHAVPGGCDLHNQTMTVTTIREERVIRHHA